VVAPSRATWERARREARGRRAGWSGPRCARAALRCSVRGGAA